MADSADQPIPQPEEAPRSNSPTNTPPVEPAPIQNTSKSKGNRKGRIENLRLWKKGQSGNPGGRPKGEWDLDNLLRKELAKCRREGNVTGAQKLIERFVDSLLESEEVNDRLLKLAFERSCGAAVQVIRNETPPTWRFNLRDAPRRSRSIDLDPLPVEPAADFDPANNGGNGHVGS